jgi:Ca2+-binding RTX toxin-like protein
MPMTAAEQYILELVNRARLNPAGEAARLGIDLNEGLAPGTISAAPKDPYAPSVYLQNAARGHSAHMDAVDTMAHSGIGDLTDVQRMQNAGYTAIGTTFYGENIAWVGTSGAVNEGALAYQNYANLFIDTFASDRGHRLNMLSDTFREMGVGEVVGTMGGYNAAILTQDFGVRGTDYFITGVAYTDANSNLFYDIGEGRGGVSVSVGANVGTTEAAGGYAVAYPGGSVLVTFSGGGLPASIGVTVAGGNHSVKVDLIGTSTVAVSQSAALGANAANLVLLGIEPISGTGNGLANTITGNFAANVIDGGAGADVMIGKEGSDTYYVDNAGDVVVEVGYQGNDLVIASVSYGLGGSVERLTLSGSANINATGNGLDNVLTGNSGANVIFGGGGVDTMIGKEGSDTYYVDNVNYTVIEAGFQGNDLIIASVSYTLGGSIERLTLSGSANINATGNGLDNVLTGNSGANVIIGGAGIDTMIGKAGSDTYYVDNAKDVAIEAGYEGNDLIVASVSYALGGSIERLTLSGSGNTTGRGNGLDNLITGNIGANFLYGLGGNDIMNGGAGGDWMTGGAGRDFMTGGAGNDRFDFNALGETGKTAATRDVITDFQHTRDDIDLSGIDARSTVANNNAFSYIGNGAFTGVEGQLRYRHEGGNTIVEGDVNGDAKTDFQIQLNGHLTLSAIDFVL